MIKAVTRTKKKKGITRILGVEVEIEGTKLEILHEFSGILNSLEGLCPDILSRALQLHEENKNHDN